MGLSLPCATLNQCDHSGENNNYEVFRCFEVVSFDRYRWHTNRLSK